jgi:hypothetical protein
MPSSSRIPFNLVFDGVATSEPFGYQFSTIWMKATGGSPPYTPVLIDKSASTSASQSANANIHLFSVGGKLFLFLQTIAVGSSAIKVYVSSNGGSTWTLSDHITITGTLALNGGGFYGVYWDGASPAATVCYPPASQLALSPLQFVDFNFSTGTFGAAYGTGGPSTTGCSALVKRADGSLVAFYTTSSNTVLNVAVYASGVWGAPQTVSSFFTGGHTLQRQNAGGVYAGNSWMELVFDPILQTCHIFLSDNTPNTYYLSFSSANVLGSPHTFPTYGGNEIWIGQGVVSGGKLIVSAAGYDPTGTFPIPIVLYGSPSSAPVWTIDTAVDPGAIAANANIIAGAISVSSGIVSMLWFAAQPGDTTVGDSSILYLATSPSFGSWTPKVQVYNQLTDDPGAVLISPGAGQSFINFVGSPLSGTGPTVTLTFKGVARIPC